MPRLLIVHGCGVADRAKRGRATSLQAVNRGLERAGFAGIPPGDASEVHIADLLSPPGERVRPWSFWAVVRQISNHVTDSSLRTRVAEAVAAAITPDTRLVIGHSLGSVAAYEALCLLPDHEVEAFVTLGSPLGIPFFVRHRLNAFSAFGRHSWPRRLRWWTNFYDPRDPVAFRSLRLLFGTGHDITDAPVLVRSGNPHRLADYLATRAVIRTIGTALS